MEKMMPTDKGLTMKISLEVLFFTFKILSILEVLATSEISRSPFCKMDRNLLAEF